MAGRSPGVDGDEAATLTQFLDHFRGEVDGLIAGVSDEQVSSPLLDATDLTIGGVVRHLAYVEDFWFQHQFLGAELPEPWRSAPFRDDPDWDFHSAVGQTVEATRTLYAEACERSRGTCEVAESLQAVAARPSDGRGSTTLRWIVVHMIEETARHAGHLDLLCDAARAETARPR